MLAARSTKRHEEGYRVPNGVGGLAHSFVRDIAELLAHELVPPVTCFVLVIGHEAGHNERHCVLRVGCRY